jgi:putative hydrolase of the HAD superfamily
MALALLLPPVIFFDAVGTLLHPEPSAPEVYAAIGRRFGSRLEEVEIAVRFRAAFRRQEEVDYASGLRTSEERELARWRAIVREVLDDVSDAEMCFQELYAHFARTAAWRCEPDAAEVLATLAARGHVLGIASNFDHRLRGLVEQMSPLRPVRHLVISSEVGWRKPAGSFFVGMGRKAGKTADEVLYIGDDEINDYKGGRAVGMHVLLLDPLQRAILPPQDRMSSLRQLLERSRS